MTIFQLKQVASRSIHAASDAIHWNYDRAELIADGVVHGIGVCAGLVAATVLIVLTAIYAKAADIVVVSIYVAGLLSMLGLSATYNLWPVSPTKWVLRRFDHSAIYMLIAATYTPLIMQMKHNIFAIALLRFGGDGAAVLCDRFRDRRRHPLQPRRDLPCLAAVALPERDLARLCAFGRRMPLYGGAVPGHDLRLPSSGLRPEDKERQRCTSPAKSWS